MTSMIDIPSDPKQIRARIRRYEAGLEREKSKYGAYNDGAGKRYFIGPLYLAMGDLAGAIDAFRWYECEFPDDMGDAGHSLCWALALYRNDDREASAEKLRAVMFQNKFVLPKLLGKDGGDVLVSDETDAFTMAEVEYIPTVFFAMWNEAEIGWAREQYEGKEFSGARSRFVEIERLLETEPVGPLRTKLVRELFRLRRGE